MSVTEPLTLLTEISLLLLIGIIGTAFSRMIKVSNLLVLLLVGYFIGVLTNRFLFDDVFLVALAIITLALVVFQGVTKYSYNQIDRISGPVLKLTLGYVLLSALFVSIISYFIFFKNTPGGLIFSLVLGFSLAGTDPSAVLMILNNTSGSIIRLLTVEAIINTPLIVLIPIMLLDLLKNSFSVQQLVGIIQQIVVGVGAGVLLAVILFKILKKFYNQDLSPVLIIAGTLLAYILAENLEGSGVLAVATLGLLFGNFNIKNKDSLQEFSKTVGTVLELIIFLLIGIIISRQVIIDTGVFLGGLMIFACLLIARLLVVLFFFKKTYSLPEIIFCSITMPKGLAVAVLIFSYRVMPLDVGGVDGIPDILLSLLFIVMIYSIITATAAGWWWNARLEQQKQDSS